MKTRFARVATSLALAALATTTVFTSAVAEESLDGKAKITATLDAKTKKATIVITGEKDGIYVNKEYPLKCDLTIKDKGTLEKAQLTKSDATYEDAGKGKEGKAKSATLKVGADKPIEGECKVVVCTVGSCSAPFKVKFASK
jgi:hypothetical protein